MRTIRCKKYHRMGYYVEYKHQNLRTIYCQVYRCLLCKTGVAEITDKDDQVTGYRCAVRGCGGKLVGLTYISGVSRYGCACGAEYLITESHSEMKRVAANETTAQADDEFFLKHRPHLGSPVNLN